MKDCLRCLSLCRATDAFDVQRLCNTKLKHQSGTCWHQNLGLGSASLGYPAAGSLPFIIAAGGSSSTRVGLMVMEDRAKLHRWHADL
jgi:hypothetical protein